MNNKSQALVGFGLAEATFLVFLVMKLLGKIDWSWWWVTSPLWVAPAFLLCLAAVLLACIGALKLVEKVRGR